MATVYQRLNNQQDITELREYLSGYEPFSNANGSLYGRPVSPELSLEGWNFGRLPDSWRRILVKWARPDYLVFSRTTLIAWHARSDQWFVPDHWYNDRTINGHQEIINRALTPYMDHVSYAPYENPIYSL